MTTGTYTGTTALLAGKTALLRVEENSNFVKAQFDDRTLAVAYGWHTFPKSDFNIHPTEDWAL